MQSDETTSTPPSSLLLLPMPPAAKAGAAPLAARLAGRARATRPEQGGGWHLHSIYRGGGS